MAAWIPFTPGNLIPAGTEQIASQILTVVSLISSVLDTLSNILDIIGNLLVGLTNVLATALKTLIDSIKNLLLDIASTGFYFLYHIPQLEAKQRTFDQWVQDVAGSIPNYKEMQKAIKIAKKDPTNPVAQDWLQRPAFSNDAYVGAIAIVLAYPSFQEFMDWWDSVKKLFDFNAYRDPIPIRKSEENLALSKFGTPRWYSSSFKQWGPFRDFINIMLEFMDSLDVFDTAENAIKEFARFLQEKADRLRKVTKAIADIIERLVKAINQTGLWALPIYGQGGNELVRNALLSTSGESADLQTSAEKGAAKAISQLNELSNQLETEQNDSFIAPPNRDSQTFTKGADTQADQSLEYLERTLKENNTTFAHTDGLGVAKAIGVANTKPMRVAYERRSGDALSGWWNASQPTAQQISAIKLGWADIYTTSSPVEAVTFLQHGDPGFSNLTYPDYVPNDAVLTFYAAQDIHYSINTNIVSVKPVSKKVAVPLTLHTVKFTGNYETPEEDIFQLMAKELFKEIKKDSYIIFDFSLFVWQNTTRDYQYFIEFLEECASAYASYIVIITSDSVLLNKTNEISEKVFSDRTAITPAQEIGEISLGQFTGEQLSKLGNWASRPRYGDHRDLGTAQGWVGSTGDNNTVNVTVPSKVSFDDDGKMIVEKREVNIGGRFEATNRPDFAELDNFAAGIMLLTGGPSAAAVESFLNLFGIAASAGAVAAKGGAEVAQQQKTTADIFSNNFGENYEYKRQTIRAEGRTVKGLGGKN